jgi:DNA-binding NarL/FixJ family response regulator
MIAGQILIVDDNEPVRRGLKSLISCRPEWKICGEAVDGVDAVEKAEALRPDIVLMDISMPRMNGLEATRVLRRKLPNTKVILVSQNDPGSVQQQTTEVDAAGFVAKSEISRKLLAMLDALAGERRHDGRADPPVRLGRHAAGGD